MKFRIVEQCGLLYPEYKSWLFWTGITVRLHTWEDRYVYYATNHEQALKAIELFKQSGDVSKATIREVQ